jgi:hypothetical protein
VNFAARFGTFNLWAVYLVLQEKTTVEPQRVEVLSDAISLAVVRMPGRRFPGIVVQGDRLVSLTGAARDIADRAKVLGDAELSRIAGNLLADLLELSTAYANACSGDDTDG